MGSCSPNGNSSEAAKTDGANMKSSSDAAQMKQGSNGSSNNNDMGSTTKKTATKPCGNNKVSPINGNTHTSAFHRVQPWTPATAGKDKADEVSKKNAAAAAAAAKEKGGEAESKHPSDDVNGGGSSAGGGQSNVIDPSGPIEGHAANYGSNSGSNNNTNNGSSAATAAATPVHAEAGGIDKRSNIMHMKRERRVAAVNKFREKRKERNFGKKVLGFSKSQPNDLARCLLFSSFFCLGFVRECIVHVAGALPEQEEAGGAAPAGARAVREAGAGGGGRGEITPRHTPSYT